MIKLLYLTRPNQARNPPPATHLVQHKGPSTKQESFSVTAGTLISIYLHVLYDIRRIKQKRNLKDNLYLNPSRAKTHDSILNNLQAWFKCVFIFLAAISVTTA